MRSTRMHEKYVRVHHNIVQKDNTTFMPENIYARRDWVHQGFPDRESTVRSWYIQRPRAGPQTRDNVNLQLVLRECANLNRRRTTSGLRYCERRRYIECVTRSVECIWMNRGHERDKSGQVTNRSGTVTKRRPWDIFERRIGG